MKIKTHCISNRHHRGFTLVELLVVITIVAVLALVSLTMVRSMRQSAQNSQCIETLRTWGIAIHGHAADNSGAVVYKNWQSIGSASRFYETYLGGDLNAPTITMDGKQVFATERYRRCPAQKWSRTGSVPVGYAMTRPYPHVSSSPSFNINTASDPSQLLLMIETADSLVLSDPDQVADAVGPISEGEESRHRHKINALFADGHISSYGGAEIVADKARLTRWFTLR